MIRWGNVFSTPTSVVKDQFLFHDYLYLFSLILSAIHTAKAKVSMSVNSFFNKDSIYCDPTSVFDGFVSLCKALFRVES